MNAKRVLRVYFLLVFGLAAYGQAQTSTLPAVADAYLKSGQPNQNQGSDPFLRVQSSGQSRSLVRFDSAAIVAAVGTGSLVSARLELYIQSNANNWGAEGRTVNAFRLLSEWTESGATWNCGIDANPANGSPDCESQWAGGQLAEEPTDTVLHANGLTGWIRFDVTVDVRGLLVGSPNYGWLLKKTEEWQSGQVDYTSRQGASERAPRLVLEVESAAFDKIPPSLAITSPRRALLVNEPSPTVVLDYADGGSGVDLASLRLALDGQDVTASCSVGTQSATCHPSALSAGLHGLEAQLRDRAGNLAQASFKFDLRLGPGPHQETFEAVADTYLRQGSPNQSQGAEPILRLQASGHNRSLVQFDAQSLAGALAGARLVSAILELHVETNGRNWGKTGRTVDAHRVMAAWAEAGATWNCPEDTNPSNQQPDCTSPWAGGVFSPAPTSSVLHTNDLGGWVSFDVTADVAAFMTGTANHGWLLKKTDESQSGRVDYNSRQGTAGEGPRLVVVFETTDAGDDTEAPLISIATPAEGGFLKVTELLVTGTVTDDGEVASVTVNRAPATITNGEFQAIVTLAEGFNEIFVLASDATGKQSFATRLVAVDLTPPALTIRTPGPGQLTNQGEIRVAGTATDNNGLAEFTVQEAAVPVVEDGFETNVPVTAGANLIAVRAVDRAGNETAANLQVIRFDLPEVTITSPVDLSFIAATTVEVSGTVSDPVARVVVNGVPAAVAGTSFTAPAVPLIEGGNILTASATDANGHVGTDSINVVRDLTAPRLAIHYPRADAVLFEPTVTVSGMVNDIVAGTVNASEATVTVNGRLAMVANRSFLVTGVPLSPGDNVLTAEARDASGNVGETRITVRRETANAPRVSILSGDHQEAAIGTALPDPLVVSLLDATGQPVIGRPVLFKVRGNNGSLDGGKRQIAVSTDASGLASTRFTLGTRAGVGNQIVEATSPGFHGPAVFTATARPGGPALLVVDSGNQQVGIAGRELPRPLVAAVTDAGHNRLAATPVRLRVAKGAGHFPNGLQEALAFSDSDGRVIIPLRLDPEEGIANNVVEARIEGLDSSPVAGFVASGRAAGDPAATSISGVVLDNSNLPIEGVTLRILDAPLTARTNEQGLFRIEGAPVSTVKLIVDGSTAERPGSWPDLEFVLTTIPGRDNTINMPIYLLPLDLSHSLQIDETNGGTLTLPDYPGFSLEILPGSVTFPGGSKSGVVSVTAVHNDKVPMVPNFGQQPRFIVTIQPAGARFEPPARLTLPNVEGLDIGEVTEMYSFDHDLGHFVSIGPATVSEDGAVIVSNPGVGIIKAGWHCGSNPDVAGTTHDCPICEKCWMGVLCLGDPEAFCKPCKPGKACDGAGQCLAGKDLIPKICGGLGIVEEDQRQLSCSQVPELEGEEGLCGAVVAVTYRRVTHNCDSIDLQGGKLEEETVSDFGCGDEGDIRRGGCPIEKDNLFAPPGSRCRDYYYLCRSDDLIPEGFSCRETVHQEIFISNGNARCRVASREIVFTITKDASGCRGDAQRH